MSIATWHTGDALEVMRTFPDASVDLCIFSPPFLALRSYLPQDHDDKHREMGSEATPGLFVDGLMLVVEECRRVLAGHGSLCIELGDTFAGSGGAGGDYNADGLREGQPKFKQGPQANDTDKQRGMAERRRSFRTQPQWGSNMVGGAGWPLAKSLTMVPELVRLTMAYGTNPLTGRETPQWRIRNVVRWVRPNPPVGALGDKFRPATTDMLVACVSSKRFFDLDAVRQPLKRPESEGHSRAGGVKYQGKPGDGISGGTETGMAWFEVNKSNAAGAPPLDWWNIPTQPYFTPDGLIVPAGGTFHPVRVPLDVHGGDIQRTTSPDCPLHASTDHQGPKVSDGAHADNDPTHSGHTDDRPERVQSSDSPPTPEHAGQSLTFDVPPDPAATTRNKTLNRTDPALSTNPSDTPYAQTTSDTHGTPTGPESSALRPDTNESNTSEAYPTADGRETVSHTADIPGPSSACTCSYTVGVSVTAEVSRDYATWPTDYWHIPTQGFKGAHYATWPKALLLKPIKAMCPEKVCVTCGVPSTRIVNAQRRNAADDSTRIKNHAAANPSSGFSSPVPEVGWEYDRETVGWSDCGHHNWRRGVVLDCFSGSGTTGEVATGLGRDAVLIDLDERNKELARQRVGPLFFVDGDLEEAAPNAR